jgi:hypothetical protein
MPYWVTILSALLTPTIAIAGTVIATLQWRTAEKKRKQDLFDRRFAVFESARNLLQETQLQGAPSSEALRSFAIGTSGAEFLFDNKIGGYIKEIGSRAVQVRRGEARAERMSDGDQRNRVIDDAANDTEWLLRQANVLEAKVKPFLQLT